MARTDSKQGSQLTQSHGPCGPWSCGGKDAARDGNRHLSDAHLVDGQRALMNRDGRSKLTSLCHWLWFRNTADSWPLSTHSLIVRLPIWEEEAPIGDLAGPEKSGCAGRAGGWTLMLQPRQVTAMMDQIRFSRLDGLGCLQIQLGTSAGMSPASQQRADTRRRDARGKRG